MITMKDLLNNSSESSPDGVHWEPALPVQPFWWRVRLRDAWAVWKGDAVAVRQTTKDDLKEQT